MAALLVLLMAVAASAPSAYGQVVAARSGNYSVLTLPDLWYGGRIDKFEPSIDRFTMELHWTKHANAFVTNLNNAFVANCTKLQPYALYRLNTAVGRNSGNVRIPTNCKTVIRNNAGGLWNHGLFFQWNLAPFGTQTYAKNASPDLKRAINRHFGSFDAMRTQFNAAAASVFGSGWAWLVMDTKSRALKITTTGNQDNPLMALPTPSSGAAATAGGYPLLGLDVWEHAYYLKYYNVRASYVGNFTNVVNWEGVSYLYAAGWNGFYSKIDVLKPYKKL